MLMMMMMSAECIEWTQIWEPLSFWLLTMTEFLKIRYDLTVIRAKKERGFEFLAHSAHTLRYYVLTIEPTVL